MSNNVPLGITVTADSKAAVPALNAVAAEEKKIAEQAVNAANQLKKQNKELENSALSAKQMSFALRQVPMQFTDIVVSLQGGQRPLQVLLQQGGQLKDSFGGVVPAVKAMTGYIAGLIGPTSLAVAAATGLGLAYFEGYKQSQILKDSLILTGNAAGATFDQLESLAQANGRVTGEYTKSRDAVNELAMSGKFAGDSLDAALRGVMATTRATGKEISDVVEVFVKLAEDPAKAVKALNNQYNFLTADVYRQIVALQEQGKTQEATTLALNSFADIMESRGTRIIENTNIFERAWNGVKRAIDSAKDSLTKVGRDATIDEQIAAVQNQLNSDSAKNYPGLKKQYQAELDELKRIKRTAEFLAKDAADYLASEKDKINAADELKKYMGNNSRYGGAGLLAKQLEEENRAFQSATRGLQKGSAEYQQALRAHEQAIANIKESANKKSRGREGKSEALQTAEDNAKLIQTFQQAVAPAQSLSARLQEQLDKYVALDPALQKYLQGLVDQAKATEEAKIAQEALNEAIQRNNEYMQGVQEYDDKDQATYDNNAKVYQDILRQTEDLNISLIKNDEERARAQIDIEHQRVVERIQLMEGEQDQIDAMLEAEEERYRTAVKTIGNETKKTRSVSQELGLTMKSSFEDAILSGKKLSDVLQGIFEDITKILLRKNITEPLADAIGSFDLGSLFGGGGDSSIIWNAKGGVYPAGDISQYSNSIVNKPTFFTGSPRAFAKGGNVMGEAGTEGIFPLKRMSNGNLGVQASGGAGNQVSVYLVETSDKGKQGTVESSDDGSTITTYVESIIDRKMQNDVRRGQGVASLLEKTYNLNRSARS